jgi:hypothetical protein
MIAVIAETEFPGDSLTFPGRQPDVIPDVPGLLFFVGPEDLNSLTGPPHALIISYF